MLKYSLDFFNKMDEMERIMVFRGKRFVKHFAEYNINICASVVIIGFLVHGKNFLMHTYPLCMLC